MKKKFIIPVFVLMAAISLSSSCEKDDPGDGTTPEIMVLGLNPLYWALELPYFDAGATAFDITPEGDTVDITDRIVTNINVDVSTIGDYDVKYNVTDESGMAAEEKVRIVKVVLGK